MIIDSNVNVPDVAAVFASGVPSITIDATSKFAPIITRLFADMTALENVMLAQYFHSMTDEQEAKNALVRVGLGDRAGCIPRDDAERRRAVVGHPPDPRPVDDAARRRGLGRAARAAARDRRVARDLRSDEEAIRLRGGHVAVARVGRDSGDERGDREDDARQVGDHRQQVRRPICARG